MTVRVYCSNPKCRKRYRVEEAQLGRAAVCKQCGREFVLSAAERDTPAPGEQSETIRPSSRATIGDVPKKIGRFEIKSRLGVGAFGAVYRAYDPVLEREVALKIPRAAALEKPEARARFLREPKAAAQLRHPHIVPVFDAGTDGDHYYIASAYIEGRTLEALIDQDRPDFRRTAEIVRDLAGALDYAHRTGVIHRDVKPANIMTDANGEVLLTDFGLARLEESEEKLTQDGSVMGTPAYLAPEQASQEFGEVGPAADNIAWALCSTNYSAARHPSAARRPYRSSTLCTRPRSRRDGPIPPSLAIWRRSVRRQWPKNKSIATPVARSWPRICDAGWKTSLSMPGAWGRLSGPPVGPVATRCWRR